MQDYITLAEKNGISLLDKGNCQFCGAKTLRGIHECLEIFNLGFQGIDFSKTEDHFYRFLIVDAHTLQHPEIHGRWNNHFHLSRLHLIFKYRINWTYADSPKLSDYLNKYKVHHADEILQPPALLDRGKITSTDFKDLNELQTKDLIKQWAKQVYEKWAMHHTIVDSIARGFLKEIQFD